MGFVQESLFVKMLKLTLLFVLASVVSGLNWDCQYTGDYIDQSLAARHFCPHCNNPLLALQFSVNVS